MDNWRPLSEKDIQYIKYIQYITMSVDIENIGCKTCEARSRNEKENESLISSLAPTCPSSKNVGDIVHMSARPTGGTAPYTVSFKKGVGTEAILLKQFTGVAENQTVTYDYTILPEDAGITHVFGDNTIDSCLFGAKTCNEQCSIAINAVCTPNWQCEQPLNGYENDGCGNRRLNIACIIPIPVPTMCGTPTCNLIIT